jgi:peptide chain release factor subunit 1
MSEDKINRYIELWKMKKLIQRLREARGAGTSMISLVCSPGTQVSQMNRLLTEEYGTATNIKSRVNRLSVLDAITSAQQRLKLYSKIPVNGLVLYCGTILTNEGKEKRVTIDFEPYKPINTSLYMCDSKFHVECLTSLLDEVDIYGFIIFNGDSCLYATLQGNTRTILYQFTVDLPKKHNKGGQSSVRFARLRMEARHNYLHKVAELATQYFITDNKCNVKGLILGGSADFKNDLANSQLFDQRLKAKVIQTVDIAYSGISGLNQAIQLSVECIGDIRFIEEKKLIQKFFTEIEMDSGKYCFGIKDVMTALEQGAVEVLLVFEGVQEVVKLYRSKQLDKVYPVFESNASITDDLIETVPFTEWVADHYTDYGTRLEFVTDFSAEGTQFAKGFSGLGGILRWKLNFDEEEYEENLDDEFN